MADDIFMQTVERLRATDKRYAAEAYELVRQGLERTAATVVRSERQVRHVTGGELSEGIREVALQQFGPMTMTVLEHWGVHSTRDFGEMVYALIQAGLFGKTEKDRLEDFDDVYDFDTAFRGPFRPKRKAGKGIPSSL